MSNMIGLFVYPRNKLQFDISKQASVDFCNRHENDYEDVHGFRSSLVVHTVIATEFDDCVHNYNELSDSSKLLCNEVIGSMQKSMKTANTDDIIEVLCTQFDGDNSYGLLDFEINRDYAKIVKSYELNIDGLRQYCRKKGVYDLASDTINKFLNCDDHSKFFVGDKEKYNIMEGGSDMTEQEYYDKQAKEYVEPETPVYVEEEGVRPLTEDEANKLAQEREEHITDEELNQMLTEEGYYDDPEHPGFVRVKDEEPKRVESSKKLVDIGELNAKAECIDNNPDEPKVFDQWK